MTMHEPVIVQAALNGGGTEGLTSAELVEDALSAWDAGAAVIHLEAHERDGRTSCADRLAPTVEAIRSAGCDAIVSLSCRSCGGARCGLDGYDFLVLRPDLAPLDCGAVGVARDGEQPSAPLAALARAVREAGTAAELRCSDARQVRTALRLRDAGLLGDPLRFQLVVDSRSGEAAAIEQVMQLTSLIPPGAIWSARTRGLGQLRLNVLCMIAGGHVRTGLEDNPWLIQDVPATNQELVERVVRIVDDLDRPLATPDEARQMLGLGSSDSDWQPIDLQVASG